ncbi:hypothetical protein C1631_007175 [Chryseobacterium phosphatilyticum]|uniref:Uncharacterized protein n=1 Tax=Chryseobacterium phosphatilyticum TaxID=475075 RepID=A0A316XEV6_9FLAO|nr:hypothetical protein [Chryseobacterium phosphatilyticum]PWN72371.1 hypothetical protein C1631_007175 [Chryseobacterium phosphatilyticum]
MSNFSFHTRTYRAIITILVLVFSLSPCSVKRDLLDIFDIQYISGLNKVKITSGSSISCETSSETSSRLSVSKSEVQLKNRESFHVNLIAKHAQRKINFNEYSGHTTGNGPPKYILFKRLKVSLV